MRGVQQTITEETGIPQSMGMLSCFPLASCCRFGGLSENGIIQTFNDDTSIVLEPFIPVSLTLMSGQGRTDPRIFKIKILIQSESDFVWVLHGSHENNISIVFLVLEIFIKESSLCRFWIQLKRVVVCFSSGDIFQTFHTICRCLDLFVRTRFCDLDFT